MCHLLKLFKYSSVGSFLGLLGGVRKSSGPRVSPFFFPAEVARYYFFAAFLMSRKVFAGWFPSFLSTLGLAE